MIMRERRRGLEQLSGELLKVIVGEERGEKVIRAWVESNRKPSEEPQPQGPSISSASVESTSCASTAILPPSPPTLNSQLHRALKEPNESQEEIVKFLLDGKANVNEVDPDPASGGNAPLHTAAANAAESIVKMLLERKADVEALHSVTRETPLHIAARNSFASSAAIVKTLIEHKGNVNVRHQMTGDTPLHIALEKNSSAGVVGVLIDSRANIDLENNQGKTPLTRLLESNRTDKELIVRSLFAPPRPRDISSDVGAAAPSGASSSPRFIFKE
jgi:ankyrin repeat protein